MNPKRILFIDDNPLDVVIAQYFLKKVNDAVEITVAENGKDAIALLEKKSFDVVFVDLDMPVMDGFQFLDFFFSTKIASHTPVVATSSSTNPAAMRRLFSHQILTFIAKPYSLSKIQELKNLLSLVVKV